MRLLTILILTVTLLSGCCWHHRHHSAGPCSEGKPNCEKVCHCPECPCPKR